MAVSRTLMPRSPDKAVDAWGVVEAGRLRLRPLLDGSSAIGSLDEIGG
jgi:hypothetical protein